MERKLQISELSIGDWVGRVGSSRLFKVCEVCLYKNGVDDILVGDLVHTHIDGSHRVHYYHAEELAPIPLTAKILDRNGFRCSVDYSGNNRTPYIFRRGKKKGPFDKVTVNFYHPTDKRLFRRGVYHELVYESPMFGGHWNFAYVKYVHELQHALRLAGIDKEIEL